MGKGGEGPGCGPRARAVSNNPAGSDGSQAAEDRMLLKVKKLLALADSPNENEAQAAMGKAHSLLLKHNVDLVELDRERQFGTRCLGEVKGRWASYEYCLTSILNEFFFVLVFAAQSYDVRRNKPGKVLQIYGSLENLNLAEYVYSYLLGLLDFLWVEYRKENHPRTHRERQRYFAGVLTGFYQKLRGQERELRETKALVWKGDQRLKMFFRYHNPKTTSLYSRGVRQTRAFQDGVLKGRQITLSRPLEDRAPGPGGLLPEGKGRGLESTASI